jgi:peptidylprolyl isomerase
VKQHNRISRWLLAAILVILVMALAACQKANDQTKITKTATPISNISADALLRTSMAPTVTPTAKPIVLEGAITTTSGLQYLEEIAGTGSAPQVGDVITMQYIASLPDGTELANSYTKDQPAKTVWGRNLLLPGWEEGIGLMKAGGKAKLVLPPDLAFGAEGYGVVPANSQVVIELELLSVEPPPTPESVPADQLKTMESGVQYFDLTLGDGAEAVVSTTVTTDYTLWVKGETEDVFIATSEGGQPVTFVLGRGDTVFTGWEEGVKGMKVGGKRLLIIPPELALGEQSSGEIPANATLIMEIELKNVRELQKATVIDEKDYITTDSGLKYYDIQVGTGETPITGQTVVVHYTGWLENGKQFDSSYDRGEAFSFQLGAGNVIPGWDEGLATMKVGGIRQLVIPPELAYGDTGAGTVIPAGATLIFEVELLEIK